MPKTSFPSDLAGRFQMRVPEALHERIKSSARLNGRSMNSEIIFRLEASFDAKAQIAPALADLLESHIEQEVNARLRAIASSIGGTK